MNIPAFFIFWASLAVVKTTKVWKCTISTWTWGLNLHFEVLVNNTQVIVAYSCLLCLVVNWVIILIQIIHRRILVWRRSSNFFSWRLPPILCLAEGEFALSLDRWQYQWFSSNFSMRIGTWTRQFLTPWKCLFTLFKSCCHCIFKWRRILF